MTIVVLIFIFKSFDGYKIVKTISNFLLDGNDRNILIKLNGLSIDYI